LTIYHSRSRGFAKGDIAVVNGAGDGIGRSAVLMLARPGLTVAAWDTEEEAMESVAIEIDG
jgi:NAD(P)-dependent dehydrogenase (short-subunit alcohol dehydrogenase family)